MAGVRGRSRGGGVNSVQTFLLRESKEFSRETPPTPKRNKHILKRSVISSHILVFQSLTEKRTQVWYWNTSLGISCLWKYISVDFTTCGSEALLSTQRFWTSKAKPLWRFYWLHSCGRFKFRFSPKHAHIPETACAPSWERAPLLPTEWNPHLKMPRTFLSRQSFFPWGGRQDTWKDLRWKAMILLIKNP